MSLPELFKNAVYLDTIENQKSKNANKDIKGFHHFVAPLRMEGTEYRALITAREKKNSNTLYVLKVEVLQMKKMPQVATSSIGSQFTEASLDISIPDLIKDIKIYNYDTQKNTVYLHEDIKYSVKDSEGRILSGEQQDYFKDSKIRDEKVAWLLYVMARQKQGLEYSIEAVTAYDSFISKPGMKIVRVATL